MPYAKTYDYLRQVGIADGGYDVASGVGVYLWEMKRKLGDPQCIQEMMPSFLLPPEEIPEGHPVIVLDAGGTYLRRAVATLHRERPTEITDYIAHPMPGSAIRADGNAFFDAVAALVRDVMDKSADISFCFSYPLVMDSIRNGRLLQLAKQLDITGIVGTDIVENLRTALGRNGLATDKTITILNDSTAVLLSGRSLPQARKYGAFAGFILGTGINMSYVESCANIAKLGNCHGMRDMIVNMEASRFSMFPQSVIDEEMDKTTTDPRDYVFEKMVAGKYLGKLGSTLLKHAAANGVLSRGFADEVIALAEITTEDLGAFFADPSGDEHLARTAARANRADAITFYLLLEAIVERAARYCAIALCAILEKSRENTDPFHPACVVAEGGTFWNFALLRERMLRHVWSYFKNVERPFYCIGKIDNAALAGAAIAALSPADRTGTDPS